MISEVSHAWLMPSCMLLLRSGLGAMKMRASWKRMVTCKATSTFNKQVKQHRQSAASSQLQLARVTSAEQDCMLP